MEMTHVAEIRASRDRVFDYLADPDKMKQWAKGMEERVDLSPDPKRAGARFTQRIREGGRVNEYDGEILAYDAPARLAVRMTRGPIAMTMDARLTEATPGVTRLEQRFSMESRSAVMRLVGRLFAPLTRSLMRRQFAALKEAAEAGG